MQFIQISLFVLFSALIPSPVFAQLVPDNTLRTSIQPNITINNILSDRVNGGAQSGNNLFHSFSEFNVGSGRAVYFANPTNITNIFTRVTGTNPSNINGTLGVEGNANLFLMNPNGIVFGTTARLDVKGSFLSTTASTINFADETVFSAVNSQPAQLLTVTIPVGLGFGSNSQAIINKSTVNNRGLQVPANKNLFMIGGEVKLEGGRLFAPGGKIELASIGESGVIGLNTNSSNWRLNIPAGISRTDISMSKAAVVDTIATRGGSVAITARNLRMSEVSYVQAGVTGTGSLDVQSGNIDVDVSDTIRMDNLSYMTARVNAGARGNAGNINVQTDSLYMTDGAQFTTSVRGQGNGGNININAKNIISFDGESSDGGIPSGVQNGVRSGAIGNGGNINITTGSLSATNGGRIVTASAGTGNAGGININATGTVSFDGLGKTIGPSAAVSEVRSGGKGDARGININAAAISITNGAQLSGRTSDKGRGGDIVLNANTLEVKDAGQIFTSTFSSGAAGNIFINATDSITLSANNPNYLQKIAEFATMNPGVVAAAGNASGLYANTSNKSSGTGGNLSIVTGRLTVRDGAVINVSSQGSGRAGNIDITSNFTNLERNALVTADVQNNQKNQANINLNTSILLMRDSSNITTNAINSTNGGNININAKVIAQINNSNITANAIQGQGGNININTQGLFASSNSKITASSEYDIDGVVNINGIEVNHENGMNDQPSRFISADAVMASSCIVRKNADGAFVVTGNNGLVESPSNNLNMAYSLLQVQPTNVSTKKTSQITSKPEWKLGDSVKEATQLVRTANGKTILTTAPMTVLPSTQDLTCSDL